MEKELDETLKACIKLLEMIATLHKKGYELIRICPHLAHQVRIGDVPFQQKTTLIKAMA